MISGFRFPLFTIFCACSLLMEAQDVGNINYHWNKGRGYNSFSHATNEGIAINNLTDSLILDCFNFPEPSTDLKLSFRLKNNNGKPNKGYPYYSPEGDKKSVKNPFYGFIIITETDTLAFTLNPHEEIYTQDSQPAVRLKFTDNNQRTIEETLRNGISTIGNDNIWSVSLSDNLLSLYAGDKGLKEIMSIPLNVSLFSGFGFFAGWGSDIVVSDISATVSQYPETTTLSNNIEDLQSYFKKSKDNMEGYWTLFDRELEETLLKTGGDYTLACIKDGEEYLFLYLDGAIVNKDKWKPGDIKIKLIPTPFEGIYYVEWHDAMKDILSNDIKAQTGEGNTLLIQFPYQSSKLRLRKISPSSGGSTSTG